MLDEEAVAIANADLILLDCPGHDDNKDDYTAMDRSFSMSGLRALVYQQYWAGSVVRDGARWCVFVCFVLIARPSASPSFLASSCSSSALAMPSRCWAWAPSSSTFAFPAPCIASFEPTEELTARPEAGGSSTRTMLTFAADMHTEVPTMNSLGLLVWRWAAHCCIGESATCRVMFVLIRFQGFSLFFFLVLVLEKK